MAVPNEWRGTVLHFLHCLKAHSVPFKVRFHYKPHHFAHTSATRETRAKNTCLRSKSNSSESISILFYHFIKFSWVWPVATHRMLLRQPVIIVLPCWHYVWSCKATIRVLQWMKWCLCWNTTLNYAVLHLKWSTAKYTIRFRTFSHLTLYIYLTFTLQPIRGCLREK